MASLVWVRGLYGPRVQKWYVSHNDMVTSWDNIIIQETVLDDLESTLSLDELKDRFPCSASKKESP